MKKPMMIVLATLTIGAGAALGAFAQSSNRALASAPMAAVAAKATPFKVDGAHSAVIYKIQHLGVSNFFGRFNEISGTWSLDAGDAAGSALDIAIKTESVDTANAGRDRHLKSPDFFNTKQFPELTFKSTKVVSSGDDTFRVTGDLSMLGVTKSITVNVKKTGERDIGGRFGYRGGFETTFTIKRSEYGMTYMLDTGGLGDEVTIMIGIEGLKE